MALAVLGEFFLQNSEKILHGGAPFGLSVDIVLPQPAIEVGVGKVNDALADRIGRLLAQNSMHYRTNSAF